jgi:hypothetical protein
MTEFFDQSSGKEKQRRLRSGTALWFLKKNEPRKTRKTRKEE